MVRELFERPGGECGYGSGRDRAVTSVIGTVLLVAVTLSAALGGFVLSGQDTT